jgi:hypothetical protein
LHALTLSRKEREKKGWELEHAFLCILSSFRFCMIYSLATCGDRLIPDGDLVVSSTFHGAASTTKAPDALARKRSEAKAGGVPRRSGPEQQEPLCCGGPLTALPTSNSKAWNTVKTPSIETT